MNISIYNQFSESAMLNNKHDIKTRNHNMDFANFRITGCERHDWWYSEFIGIESNDDLKLNMESHFALLSIRRYAQFLKPPLALWMFIACDEDGKPLEECNEPNKEDY